MSLPIWHGCGSAKQVTFPCWFWGRPNGPNREEGPVLSVDGTYPSIWTHWTPVVNSMPPAGPREKAVTRWAEEAARKLHPKCERMDDVRITDTSRVIQEAIDGALADARQTIVVEVIPILAKVGRFHARSSMDEVTKILSSI